MYAPFREIDDDSSEEEINGRDDDQSDYSDDERSKISNSSRFVPNPIPTCEAAPFSSASHKVIEPVSSQQKNNIVITQNLKTPIILTPNLSNISDVKDQHLAGCAGESQGLP